MKHSAQWTKLIGFAGIFLFIIILFSFPQEAAAGGKIISIEGVSYNVDFPLVENLRTLIGKKVFVHLDSGLTLNGKVKEIGTHLMHLEEIQGRDFFDSLIRMDHIVAVDTQFRKYN